MGQEMHPPKCPITWGDSGPNRPTWHLGYITDHTSNGTSTDSAILYGSQLWPTDRHTDDATSVATGHIVSKYKLINVHNGQQKPNLRCKKGVKWIGRSAGNSGSWVDDKRYQDWYKYGEMEGEFQILGVATLKLWAQNDVRTNGAEKSSVEESEGTSWMTGMQGWM